MGATVRKDREWWRVTLHQAGKRKCWHYKDRRVAQLKAKELDYRLIMEGWGFWDRPADEAFQTYAKRQLGLWSNSLKPSTLHTWQHCLEHHVYPTFGAMPLNEITRTALKDFFTGLTKKGLRRYTVLNVLVPLRRILQEGVEEGRLAVNPAAGIGRSVLPRNERPFEGKVYTPHQVQLLLNVCKQKWQDRYPLLLCLIQTGLRLGEALALEWSDVDWSNGSLTIRNPNRWP